MEILIDAFSVLTGNYQYSGSMFPGVEEALIHLTLIKDESSTYVAAAPPPPEVYRLAIAVNEVISRGQGPYVMPHFAYMDLQWDEVRHQLGIVVSAVMAAAKILQDFNTW